MEAPDFIEAPHAVESVKVTSVARRKLARFKIAAAQTRITKHLWRLPREKVETQPAAVGRGHSLCLAEERDEQKENQISVHLRLQLQITGKVFRRDLAHSAFKLKGGVQ